MRSNGEAPKPFVELAASFRALQLVVLVRVSRGVLQLEMRSLAPSRWGKVLALNTRNFERIFAVVVDDGVDARHLHAFTWFVCAVASHKFAPRVDDERWTATAVPCRRVGPVMA